MSETKKRGGSTTIDSTSTSGTRSKKSQLGDEKPNNKHSSEEEVQEVISKAVEGTPFRVNSIDGGKNWVITTGTYRITPTDYKSEKEARKIIEDRGWEIIVGMISAIVDVQITARSIGKGAF